MELAEIFVHLNGIRTNLKTPFGASRWRLCTMIKLPYIAVLQFHNAPWLRNRRLRRHINRTRGENAVATIDLVRSLRIVYISIILLLIFVALRLCRCWLLKYISFWSYMKWRFSTPRRCHYSNSMALLDLLIIVVAILSLIGRSSLAVIL